MNESDTNFFNYAAKNTKIVTRPHEIKHLASYYKHKNYSDPVKFAKNSFATDFTGIIAHRDNAFYETFKNAFQRLFEAGITSVINVKSSNKEVGKAIDRLLSKHSHEEFKVYNEKKELVALSLSHLSPGFIIWLTALVLVILVFFLEILHYKCSKAWKEFLLKREAEVIMKNENKIKVRFIKVAQK